MRISTIRKSTHMVFRNTVGDNVTVPMNLFDRQFIGGRRFFASRNKIEGTNFSRRVSSPASLRPNGKATDCQQREH